MHDVRAALWPSKRHAMLNSTSCGKDSSDMGAFEKTLKPLAHIYCITVVWALKKHFSYF